MQESQSPTVWALSYSTDGKYLAATYGEGVIRVYRVDVEPTQRVGELVSRGESRHVRTIVAGRTPEEFFAVLDSDGLLRIRVVGSELVAEQLSTSDTVNWALAASPRRDGSLIAGLGSKVSLFRPSGSSGWIEQVLSQGVGVATSAAWSGDSQSIAVGFSDGIVRVWRADRLTSPAKSLNVIRQPLRGLALNKDGRLLYGAGDDGFLYRIPLDFSAGAEQLCKMVKRNLTQDEWREFVGTSLPYERTCTQFSDTSKP